MALYGRLFIVSTGIRVDGAASSPPPPPPPPAPAASPAQLRPVRARGGALRSAHHRSSATGDPSCEYVMLRCKMVATCTM